MHEGWEWMARTVLAMLAQRRISPEQAESWIWVLVEFAEAQEA